MQSTESHPGSGRIRWRVHSDDGPVWTAAFVDSGDTTAALATAGANGEIRLFSRVEDKNRLVLRGHSGAVLALSAGLIHGRSILASAGIDGSVRLWDANGGVEVAVFQGHVGGVRGVAIGGSSNAPYLASSGADGTVRLWDLESGESIVTEGEGHTGSALAVAFQNFDDRVVLASAGDDATVRLWDASSGRPLRDPLRGHLGGVRALAFSRIEGRPILASASDDGTVRLWNTEVDAPIRRPLVGHTGIVRSVAFGEVAGVQILASAGIDGRVRLWDPHTGEPFNTSIRTPANDNRFVAILSGGPEVASIAVADGTGVSSALVADVAELARLQWGASGRSSIVSADSVSSNDLFGRKVLAAHLHGVIDQLLSPARAESSDVVVSIDGRWGAGKTTLAHLLVNEMKVRTPDSKGAGAPLEGEISRALERPVVIHFNSWRESNIAPHWWAIAAALNRGIRAERSFVACLGMSVSGAWLRVLRTPAPLVALLVVAALVLGVMLITSSAPDQLQSTLVVLQTSLAAAAALFATAYIGTRFLFWASPAFGKLHVRADDNPLGEVAEMITNLRRWSPRLGTSKSSEVAIFAVGCSLAVLEIRLFIEVPQLIVVGDDTSAWVQSHAAEPLLGLIIGGIYLASVIRGRRGRGRTGLHIGRSSKRARPAVEAGTSNLLIEVLRSIAIGLLVSGSIAVPITSDEGRARLAFWMLAIAALFVTFSWAVFRRGRPPAPRRPVVLIIDELDRCDVQTVVAYLETIHTLLRRREGAQGLSRWEKRDLAPLVVLVLADGRWIRTSFTKAYESFESLGSPVRSLGGDFLQKLFDHTVLVPDLTPDHVERMLADVVSTEGSSAGSKRPPNVDGLDLPNSVNSDRDVASGDAASPIEVTAPGVDSPTASADAAERARLAGGRAATVIREAHLLTSYRRLLPANPRLIRRVANAWGMLDVLKEHIGHDEPDEVVVRAAVAFVVYPSLVDKLLDATSVPLAPDPREPEKESSQAAIWSRPEILDLLSRPDGTSISIESLASCYGKYFPGGE